MAVHHLQVTERQCNCADMFNMKWPFTTEGCRGVALGSCLLMGNYCIMLLPFFPSYFLRCCRLFIIFIVVLYKIKAFSKVLCVPITTRWCTLYHFYTISLRLAVSRLFNPSSQISLEILVLF